MQKRKYLWAVVAVVVIAAVGVGWQKKSGNVSNIATTTDQTGSSTLITSDLGNGITATGPGKIELVPIDEGTPPPSLTGELVFASTLSPEVKAALQAKEDSLIAELKRTPNRLDLWLQLGLYRKMAGDYIGAKEAWEYVSKTGAPNITYIAYGNLGSLYLDVLKDYPKAEANYKAAIAINPTFIDYYRNLYVLYSSLYKTNTRAARDIIDAGLKANPNHPDLLKLKAELEAKPGF